MTKKQVALFAALMLAMVIIGDSRPERMVMAQSGRASSASASQSQSAPANAATWEYKILYDTRIAALETAINQVSEQGFVVDSLQIASHRTDNNSVGLVRRDSSGHVTPVGAFELSSETEMVVLLKRSRK
jgi:hypothetical protein